MPESNETKNATTKDIEIQLLNALKAETPGTVEHSSILAEYTEFMITQTKIRESKKAVSVWAPIVGNIAGIGFIGLFEAYGQIFSSKATSIFLRSTGR